VGRSRVGRPWVQQPPATGLSAAVQTAERGQHGRAFGPVGTNRRQRVHAAPATPPSPWGGCGPKLKNAARDRDRTVGASSRDVNGRRRFRHQCDRRAAGVQCVTGHRWSTPELSPVAAEGRPHRIQLSARRAITRPPEEEVAHKSSVRSSPGSGRQPRCTAATRPCCGPSTAAGAANPRPPERPTTQLGSPKTAGRERRRLASRRES